MSIFNLGVACGTAGDSTSFYRAMGPFGHLRKITKDFTMTLLREVNWSVLKQVDGVFMHRPFTQDHLALCRMVKTFRRPLWIDHDDNLFEVGLDNPTFGVYGNNAAKEAVASMLEIADVVTVSTPYLGQVYERFTDKPIITVPNALDDDLLDVNAPPKPSKQTVFWRGSNTHYKDWAFAAQDFMKVATENHGKGWKYAFMGAQPWDIMEKLIGVMGVENLMSIEGTDVMRYFAIIKEISPKISVVPLFPSHFNLSKSNVAWLEATYAGAAVLGPNWHEWTKPGITNYVASGDKPTDFGERLTDLLNMSDEDRMKLRNTSWDYIKKNLLLSVVNYQRRGIFEKYMLK